MHLLVDGLATKPIKPRKARRFLVKAVHRVRMHIIDGPCVLSHPESLQGFVMLAESHVAIHIRSTNQVFVDLFSCNDFDVAKAVNFTRGRLQLEDVIVQAMDRGITASVRTNYPKSRPLAGQPS